MIIVESIIILVFAIITITAVFYKRKVVEKTSFFAGRGLTWPVIGICIIAANISTEHFIGMAGSGYRTGLAVGSHEWTAVIALVIISVYVIPKFMSLGVKTIPEYLEYRFNHWTRLIVSVFLILFTVFIQFSSIIYGSALAIQTIFGINQYWIFIFFSILTSFFTIIGGLSSVVRSNIIFAITFLVGGLVITFIGFYHLGGLDQFINRSNGKLVALLPADNNYLPWTSVFFGGLWVAQFYYFGCNQFITQYLLSGKTLTDAQKGVLFAATIKLIIPLIVIFPGIISFELLGDQLSNPDLAYPKLIEFLSKGLIGLKAVVFCMLVGAAVSSLNSMMIASANLFTNDIYLRYFNRSPSEKQVKMIGRSSTIIFIIIGCIWAPFIASFNGSFEYMQKFAGMISPGILTVFIIALYSQRTPSFVAIVILLLNIPIYECCFLLFPQWSFYDVIGITFLGLFITGIVLGNLFPLKTAVVMPENFNVKFERNLLVIIWSIFLITFIAFSYMLFL